MRNVGKTRVRIGPVLVYLVGLLEAQIWCWIWARIKINVAQIWASSGLFYLFIFMADMQSTYGLLVAQIANLQTGEDNPNAIICKVLDLAFRFGPVLLNLVYSWLTLGLPLACLWPKSGKKYLPKCHQVSAQICPSAIIPCGIWARWMCQVWAWSGTQEFCYLGMLSLFVKE